MTIEMWIGFALVAWCAISVPVGLIVGAIVQGRKRRAAAVLPASCLMCELEASHA